MKYNILEAKAISIEKWDNYINKNTNSGIFHTPYVYNIYRRTPGYRSFAFFSVDENKNIKALLSGYVQIVKPGLFKNISKRAVLMQSPLYDNIEALEALIHYYCQTMQKEVVYTEIRNHIDTSLVSGIYKKNGFLLEDHLNIIIDISQTEEKLWAQVHSKRRNEIRKAFKYNIKVKEVSKYQLNDIYKILKEVYSRARLPLIQYNFFNNALQLNKNNYGMIIYGAFYKNILIGTMVTLYYKDIVFDFYAGSLYEYYDKHPNDIIPWKVFLDYKNQGFKTFDFGGAGKPDEPYGVRDYKKKFGGEIINYGRYINIHSQLKYKIAKCGFELIKKLK